MLFPSATSRSQVIIQNRSYWATRYAYTFHHISHYTVSWNFSFALSLATSVTGDEATTTKFRKQIFQYSKRWCKVPVVIIRLNLEEVSECSDGRKSIGSFIEVQNLICSFLRSRTTNSFRLLLHKFSRQIKIEGPWKATWLNPGKENNDLPILGIALQCSEKFRLSSLVHSSEGFPTMKNAQNSRDNQQPTLLKILQMPTLEYSIVLVVIKFKRVWITSFGKKLNWRFIQLQITKFSFLLSFHGISSSYS